MLRSFKYGIQNIFSFFKVIWTWRYWDYHYFLKLLVFVLKRMEHDFSKYGSHLYVNKDVRKMKVARLLLERVMEDDYYSMVFKDHDKKWGKLDITWEASDKYKGCSQMISTRPKVFTKQEKEQEEKEYQRLMGKPEQLKRRDLDYAFSIISKNMLGWWD